jgi:hypothetical protein
MKVSSNLKESNSIKADKMKIGQLGIFNDEIVIRAYECLISLTDPSITYDKYAMPFHSIELLPVGTVVTLEIDGSETLNDEEC